MFSECFHSGPSDGWDRASFKADMNDHRLGDLYGILPEAVLA